MGCIVNVRAIANSHVWFEICVWFDVFLIAKIARNDYEFTEKEGKNRHIPIL